MRPRDAILRLVLALVLGGCISDRGFPCTQNDRCVLDGEQGRCEAAGWCSYTDPDCEGGRRFDALADDGFGGLCVGLCGATALVAGTDHNCVTALDGRVWCWGDNEDAQLGLGAQSGPDAGPRLAIALEGLAGTDGFVAPLSAADHTCGLGDDGVLWCWGNNADQQITDGGGSPLLLPSPAANARPNRVGTGPRLTCSSSGNTLTCQGDLASMLGQFTVDVTDDVVDIAVGDRHGCVQLARSAVLCVGEIDRIGGEPVAIAGAIPVAVPLDGGVKDVAVGPNHTCAIVAGLDGDEVRCWGLNESGQCGVAPPNSVEVPTQIVGLPPGAYEELALGAGHSCVRGENGGVWCWGDGTNGKVSAEVNAVALDPVAVTFAGQPLAALQIAAGARHTCARTEEAIVCWGDNTWFQLGTQDDTSEHRIELDCR